MAEYTDRFAEERVEIDVLSELTDQDLERLGIPLGHRRRILKAIRELDQRPPATPQVPTVDSPTLQDSAERRQLTVMFCDLVGSTALSTRLDPEDLRGIIGAYHRCCTELIEGHGGFVAKYMGDGVLAYFGYPRAHEHDAERAVRAGLAMVEAVPNVDANAGAALQVRVGISTGLVVVGDLVGSGEAQERGVVGETPNLAARLQGLAEPGAVLISASTHKLIGGLFEYRDLGAVAIKGFAEDVAMWQVLEASALESRFEAMRKATTPLVGRDEELDLLARRWEQAKRGDGQVVLISGEAGIGKSRVTQTALERISTEPHTRLRYFCSPHHQDSALYPSITQLERAAEFRREDTDAQRLDKLEAVLGQATTNLAQAVPLLAALLSIPTGNRYAPLHFTPQKQREKTLQVLLGLVKGLAARRPVLLTVEDAHWIDPTSLELLHLTVDQGTTVPILLIITFRPEFSPPWAGRPHVTLISLSRLSPQQRGEMIRHMTGDKALPEEINDQIIDRTDGVPLFIEELTKTVVESGIVIETGDRYALVGPVARLAIPTTLHASLLARLDRLAAARDVAQIAAALGRSFSHELISAVAAMPQQQLHDALAQLFKAELIFGRGTPPDAEYTFKHALVRDAAYGTLLRSQRQQVHARIATALESKFPEVMVMQPVLLAHHCAEAGLTQKAISYSLKAGQQAIARSAMREAEAQLRQGLDLLPGVRDAAVRQEHELDLQLALGHALAVTTGYAAHKRGETIARARQLCEQLDRPEQMAPIIAQQFYFRLVRGELKQAKGDAEDFRRLVGHEAIWKLFSGLAYFHLGKFVDARAHLENALSAWNPRHRTSKLAPGDAYVVIRSFLSRTLYCLGYVDQARVWRDEALAEARRLPPYSLVCALGFGWYGDWAIGGVSSAQTILQSANELLAVSSEHGFPLWSAIGNIMRGWCLGAMHPAAEGIPLLVQGITDASATGWRVDLAFAHVMLAEVYAMARQVKEGLNRLSEAAKLVEMTQERWAEAEVHRQRGTLLLAVQEHAEAEDSYCLALAVARRQSAKLWELRAASSLAHLWLDQGKCTEARDLLAPIYGWFTEGFDTPVLQDAKSLLEQLQS
jgi:class 3 adenylate cyclase/tetratricopeptide (TPR) repeat protein